MSEPSGEDAVKQTSRKLSRRHALAKLGLGSAIAYAAPIVLDLGYDAEALHITVCVGHSPGDITCGG